MPAAPYDIFIEQGTTWSLPLVWKDETGALKNLTGYTARMQIRATAASGTTLADLTDANGKITLGGAAGTITLTLTPTDTSAIPPGTYVYDLELVAGGGVVTRLLKGGVTVDAEVTR